MELVSNREVFLELGAAAALTAVGCASIANPYPSLSLLAMGVGVVSLRVFPRLKELVLSEMPGLSPHIFGFSLLYGVVSNVLTYKAGVLATFSLAVMGIGLAILIENRHPKLCEYVFLSSIFSGIVLLSHLVARRFS